MNIKLIIGVIIILIIGFVIFNYRSVPDDVQTAEVSDVATENADENMADDGSAADVSDSSGDDGDMTEISDFTFIFTGYGPAGKVHEGTFIQKSFMASVNDSGELTGGKVIFKTNSVDTGIEALNKHLCNEDFFICNENPEASFVIESVTKSDVENNNYEISGVMTLKGIEKQVSFTATKDARNYSGEFLLNVKSFDFQYTGIDENVLITFNFEV